MLLAFLSAPSAFPFLLPVTALLSYDKPPVAHTKDFPNTATADCSFLPCRFLRFSSCRKGLHRKEQFPLRNLWQYLLLHTYLSKDLINMPQWKHQTSDQIIFLSGKYHHQQTPAGLQLSFLLPALEVELSDALHFSS